MHGSVLSKYDNRDLESYDYRDFGISAEAYLSLGIIFIIYQILDGNGIKSTS
jgi:hypothetical protein